MRLRSRRSLRGIAVRSGDLYSGTGGLTRLRVCLALLCALLLREKAGLVLLVDLLLAQSLSLAILRSASGGIAGRDGRGGGGGGGRRMRGRRLRLRLLLGNGGNRRRRWWRRRQTDERGQLQRREKGCAELIGPHV